MLARITRAPLHVFPAGTLLRDRGVLIGAEMLRGSRLVLAPAGEVTLEVPLPAHDLAAISYQSWRSGSFQLPAEHARTLLRRGMVRVNAAGAHGERVQMAVNLLAAVGSSEGFLRVAAERRAPLEDARLDSWTRSARMLAVEMAVHEELERDALRGELAALEEAWRQAETIAGIADRLPDVNSEPPRLEG